MAREPDDRIKLTLYDSTQGVHWVAQAIAPLFGLDPEQVRVVAPYVGGGFGSKGTPHAHNTLAALAARLVPGRTVKLALTRQAMFTLTGQRTPTVQRLRLAADKDGTLRGIGHDAIEHTSRVKDFIEQTAELSRMMYAAENRRTSHRVASLDVPVPTYMRALGEAPGSFGLEVAMDELAVACGIDPIELRRRNEPERDPGLDKPWVDRRVIECLTERAARFGWQQRDPRPGVRRDGEWLEGTGVAVATYPHMAFPGSAAEIDFDESGYQVRIGAVDIESICIGEADPRASAMGARGAGELGTVGVAAAIANATYHATGKRVRDLPLAPERFLTPVAG